MSSLFELPINKMCLFMEKLDLENLEEENIEKFEKYFTCYEIKNLFEAIIKFVNNIKFSNQIFTEDDAQALLQLSKAKIFYSKFRDLNGLGICCNNIGNIHLKQGRYYEAVAEYQESILMSKIEDEETKEKLNQIINKNKQPSKSGNTLQRNNIFSSKKIKQSVQSFSKDYNFQISNVNDLKSHDFIGDHNDYSLYNKNCENIQVCNHPSEVNQYDKENGAFNEGDNQDPEKKELIDKRHFTRINLLNRKYQLGVALFQYSSQQEEIFYSQAIRLFDQCLKLCDKQEQSKTNLIRQITIHTKKAFCHVKTGEYEHAAESLKQADELYLELQDSLDQKLDNSADKSNKFFLDIFKNIPIEVVHSHIQLIRVIIELTKLNFNSAMDYLTKIIEQGSYYEPRIRKQALLIMKNIFQNFTTVEDRSLELINERIQKFNFKSFDIIMLIDYSCNMSEEQLRQSHLICEQVFQTLRGKDRIGFMIFNDSVHQQFALQQKDHYELLIRKKIKTMQLNTSGGSSNLYQSLKVTSSMFEFEDRFAHCQDDQRMSGQKQEEKKKYIFLCTEGANPLLPAEFKIIQQKLNEKKISLLICHISNQNANMLYLKCLANITENFESKFFADESEITEFFTKLVENEIEHQFIVEYF